MKIIKNYNCKDYRFRGIAIFIDIIGLIAVFSALVGYVVILHDILDSQLGGIPFLLLPIFIQFFVLKHMRAWSKLANSATFNITFYTDRFEYRGLIGHKTIYYAEVECLIDLDMVLTSRFSSIYFKIYQITTKNQKTIQLCCKKLSKKDSEKLKADLTEHTGITMESKNANFPKFK